MAKFNSRGARLTALALATGTLVVASTGSAGAAPVTVPTIFGGTANATSIRVTVNLPVAIPTSVPMLGGITAIEQDISFVEGNTAKSLNPQVSVAKAVLGNGTVSDLATVLGKSVTARLDGAHEASDAILAKNVDGLIDVGIGKINSSVAPDTATSALTSSSTSSLASLKIGLSGLNLPIKTDLQSVVDSLNNTVDTAQGTVTAAVNDALDAINQATAHAAQPVVDQANAVKSELTSLLDSLQKTLGSLSADSSLVTLSLLESTENITRAGAMVTAKATSNVGGLDILNGLVHLDAVKTESVSSANGVAGSAAADTLTTILGLKVSNILDLKLTSNGLEGTIGGNALPDAAKDAVKTVINAVNGVLATAGVQIVNGATTHNVDPAGKYASSSSDGVGIIVNPLHATKPLVAVQLVPASTAVNAAIVKAPQRPTVKTPTDKSLARTGANLPALAVAGMVLVGFALVVRRRRFVEA